MTNETIEPDQTEAQERPPPIVYLIDDDRSFLRRSSRLLRSAEYRVETFGSTEEFLKYDRSQATGCVVLELKMRRFSGLELQEALAQAEQPLPVVFVAAHGDVSSAVRAMKQGAVDFLTKPVRRDVLLEAVQRALAQSGAKGEAREWRARYERLTPREREVLALVVDGRANKQIADMLGTTERTIKAHRRQVMHKMGVQSPAELGRTVEYLGKFFQKLTLR
jgi:FixJ family two-component response regulator